MQVKREKVREKASKRGKEIVRESERELGRNLEMKRTREKASEGE